MAVKLKWQFGQNYDNLLKEVDSIVGDVTIEELMTKLPPSIKYDENQEARLIIKKLGKYVWSVSYVVYKDPATRNFESVSVYYVTEPSLKLALFEMLQELKR